MERRRAGREISSARFGCTDGGFEGVLGGRLEKPSLDQGTVRDRAVGIKQAITQLADRELAGQQVGIVIRPAVGRRLAEAKIGGPASAHFGGRPPRLAFFEANDRRAIKGERGLGGDGVVVPIGQRLRGAARLVKDECR